MRPQAVVAMFASLLSGSKQMVHVAWFSVDVIKYVSILIILSLICLFQFWKKRKTKMKTKTKMKIKGFDKNNGYVSAGNRTPGCCLEGNHVTTTSLRLALVDEIWCGIRTHAAYNTHLDLR